MTLLPFWTIRATLDRGLSTSVTDAPSAFLKPASVTPTKLLYHFLGMVLPSASRLLAFGFGSVALTASIMSSRHH